MDLARGERKLRPSAGVARSGARAEITAKLASIHGTHFSALPESSGFGAGTAGLSGSRWQQQACKLELVPQQQGREFAAQPDCSAASLAESAAKRSAQLP